MKTELLSVAKPRLAKLIDEERVKIEALGGRAAKGSMTVGEAMTTRLAQIDNDPSLKPRTRQYYRFLHDYLRRTWPLLSSEDVRNVTISDCESWAGKSSKEVSATIFNNATSELRKILSIAVNDGLRSTNPADGIKRKSPRRKDLSAKLPTKALFGEWVHEIRNAGSRFSPHCADFVEFLAYSGLRLDEAKWVRWGHCDFEQGELLVIGNPESATKNGEIRRIPMIPALRVLLERVRDENFDTSANIPVLAVNRAQKAMDRAGKVVGIPRITHHDLRHFFATMCIESGVGLPLVGS